MMPCRRPEEKRQLISAEMVAIVLDYDPFTGIFRWKIRRGPCRIGEIAGSWNKGRRRIRVFGSLWEAGQIAFLLMEGRWPKEEIDHRDGDPSNNRWENLREATHKQNCMNKGALKNSQIGIRGVVKLKNQAGYSARMMVDGSNHWLGVYPTAKLAAGACRIFASAMHGEFSYFSAME